MYFFDFCCRLSLGTSFTAADHVFRLSLVRMGTRGDELDHSACRFLAFTTSSDPDKILRPTNINLTL